MAMNWDTPLEKVMALEYCRKISTSYEPKTEEVKVALDSILQEVICITGYSGANRPTNLKKLLFSIQSIVLSVFAAHSASTELFVRISLNRNHYNPRPKKRRGPGAPTKIKFKLKIDRRKKRLAYEFVTLVLDGLVELDYLDSYPGYYHPERMEGKQTRIKATAKLIDILTENHGVMRYMIVDDSKTDLIVLRDLEKDKVDFQPTSNTEEMRQDMCRINEALADTYLCLDLDNDDYKVIESRVLEKWANLKPWEERYYFQPFDLHSKSLRRVFNNSSFEMGGRLYGGWWQGIPKRFRVYIRIDGAVTAEVDYSCMHIVMLYAEAGLELEGDAYMPPGFPPSARDKLKKSLNAMINAKSVKSALAVIKQIFSYKTRGEAQKVVDAFLELHASVAHRFNEEHLGVYLQYKDSQVAIAVMLAMQARGVVVLPVHDSFLVAVEHEELLTKVMTSEFNRLMGAVPRSKSSEKWLDYHLDRYDLPDKKSISTYLNELDNIRAEDPKYSRHFQYKAEYYQQLMIS